MLKIIFLFIQGNPLSRLNYVIFIYNTVIFFKRRFFRIMVVILVIIIISFTKFRYDIYSALFKRFF